MKIELILVVFSFVQCLASEDDWRDFKKRYNKNYDNDIEDNYRRKIFIQNNELILNHNDKFHRGDTDYMLSMNQFGDLLPHEVISSGFTTPDNSADTNETHHDNSSLPSSIDWRDKGALSPVKSPCQTTVPWAYSTVGAVESHLFIKTGKLLSLSEQQLAECCVNNSLANISDAWGFDCIMSTGGIDTEESYPCAPEIGKCHFNTETVGTPLTGYKAVAAGDEVALKDVIATSGPAVSAVDASHVSFMFYTNGVYYEANCSTSEVDHAVLIVGYGTEGGADYWLLRNSWGPEWGMGGYMKLSRNKNNHCGIASTVNYPII